jgi:heme/copper-type cytochrome/quinol oxidase subunit 1
MQQASKTYSFFNIKTNPQHLLILIALPLFVVSLFVADTSIDINLHDIYFVIVYSLLFRAIAVVLLVLWVVYIAANKLLPLKSLNWLHVSITILTLSIFIIKISTFIGLSGAPRRYYALAEFEQQRQTEYLLVYNIIALLFAQLLFIANLITGIIKKLTSSPAK